MKRRLRPINKNISMMSKRKNKQIDNENEVLNGVGAMRILFFIGNLGAGGKERRLVELLTFLKAKGGFEILVVLTNNEISYPAFHKLDIPIHLLRKKWEKYDPTVFLQLYKICLKFKPHFAHSWGAVQTFYLLPSIILQKIPLINGQITDACPKNKVSLQSRIINYFNFKYSKVILSNSEAGLYSYSSPPNKSQVIYNGINLNRFDRLCEVSQVKKMFGLKTTYVAVMVASYSHKKDYDYFRRIAELVTEKYEDITFIGVGGHDFPDTSYYRLKQQNRNPRIIFEDLVEDVESLVNACDIGVLFSNTRVHGEGISNAIMEYMSLSKPVIANDAGGTKEIVQHGINGFLIQNHTDIQVRDLFLELINNKEKRRFLGQNGRTRIVNEFSLDKMGSEFAKVYRQTKNLVAL